MEGDLKDQISQVLSPDVARQLATTVGLDDRQGKTFVDAAVPTLLSALGSLDPNGGKALSDAVSNADPNTLEKLRRALDARDLGPLNAGASALGPVLGAATRDKIASALADYLGVPTDATVPALGAVEQAAVAVLGQQDPSVWGDGEALRGFLSSQKAAFTAAIPAAIAGAVSAPAPVAPPPPAAPAPAPTVAAAPRPAPPPPPPPRPAPPPPPPQTSSGGWIWIVILIVVIVAAAGGWYWWTYLRPEAKTGLLAPTPTYAPLATPRG